MRLLIASPDNDYTYDDLDRLTEVDYHNGEDEQFTYDKLGNRENVKMREGGDVDYYVNDLVNQYAGIGAPPGHWKLNDKPGAYAIDATNDYDGTIYSANWTGSGKFEDALILDGVNDYVEMDGGDGGDSFAGVAGANPRTIAAWIDPNQPGVIASWGTDDSGGDKPVWNFVVATGEDFDFILGVVVNDSGAITGIGTGFDTGGGWQHAAVTFDGSELLLYINGNPSDPVTLTGVNTNASVYARIGVSSDVEGGYFEGKIDNVMIFDRALSTEEIVALADAGNDNVLSVAATVYDKAGNLTTDYRGYQYSYDYENRLIEVKDNDDTSIVEYAYDALGRRIEKDDKIAGEITRYYNNHDWQVLAEYDDNDYHLRSYIYGGYIDEVLVMVDPNAAEDYYYAHNHLYSPTALLDDSGAIIERYDYDAYGRPYFMEPNFILRNEQKSAYENTVMFTGRQVDILDNGSLTLQYSRNRYYDYQTGRMLTRDSFGAAPNIFDPDGFDMLKQYRHGLSLYQYVGSRPSKYKDPFGWYYDPSENNDGEWQNGDDIESGNVNEDEKEDPWNGECNSSTVGETRTRVTEVKIISAGFDCDGDTKSKAKIAISFSMTAAFMSGDLEALGKMMVYMEFLDVMEVSCTAGTKMCVEIESKECVNTLSFWKFIIGSRNPFVYSWEGGEPEWYECEGGTNWVDELECYVDPAGAREDLKNCLRDLGISLGNK